MQNCYVLKWLEVNIGFETYQHLGDRSLERISYFFKEYKDTILERKVKIITVAGTNGKGQCCYSMASILSSFNKSFGLFISPHVHCITERFQTHQGSIEKDKLFEIFQKVYSRQTQLNFKLSFFEFLFASFLHMVIEQNLPILLLEVGVGGRLDATNLFDANVAIITSIGRDHQDLLGKRLDLILNEKMGIVRKDQVLFTAFSSRYLLKLSMDQSLKLGAIQRNIYEEVKSKYGVSFEYINRYLALLAIKFNQPDLDWNNFDETKYITKTSDLPGRGEMLYTHNHSLYLYGSHNLDGMRAWVRSDLSLRAEIHYDQVYLAFSKRSFKDIVHLLKLWISVHLKYKNKYKTLTITTFDHLKSFKPTESEISEIKSLLVENNQPITTINWLSNWKEYNRFSRINTTSNILVIGSFYFVSDVKQSFREVFL